MEEGTQPEAGAPRKKRLWLIVVIVAAAVIFVLAAAGGIYALLFSGASRNIEVGRLDLSSVADGTYEGEVNVYHVSGQVRVTVEDHRITKIESLGSSANKEQVSAALDEVVEKQSLQVDTISGATVSQKVALKAIEKAIERRPE